MRDDLRAWLDILREAGPWAVLRDGCALALILGGGFVALILADALLHGAP